MAFSTSRTRKTNRCLPPEPNEEEQKLCCHWERQQEYAVECARSWFDIDLFDLKCRISHQNCILLFSTQTKKLQTLLQKEKNSNNFEIKAKGKSSFFALLRICERFEWWCKTGPKMAKFYGPNSHELTTQCQCTPVINRPIFRMSTQFVQKFQVDSCFGVGRCRRHRSVSVLRLIFHYFILPKKKWMGRKCDASVCVCLCMRFGDCYKIMKINDRDLTAWWLFIAATLHLRC